MSYVWLLSIFIISLIPIFGVLGYTLGRKLGKEKYQKTVLPKLQNLLSYLLGFQGNMFVQALNPSEWKTDKKSILLIVIGIPIGCVLIFSVLLLAMLILDI